MQSLESVFSHQGCKQFLKELTKKIASQKKKQQQMYKKMLNLEEEEKEKKMTSFGEKETTWLEVMYCTVICLHILYNIPTTEAKAIIKSGLVLITCVGRAQQIIFIWYMRRQIRTIILYIKHVFFCQH